MMRQSETMRAASRLLLSHPIVCLLAVLAAGVVLGVLGPIMVVHATDVAPVEAENFDNKPTGTSVVTNTTLYQNDQALRFNNNTAIAKEAVDFTSSTSSHDVVLVARAGQSGGGGGGLTYIGSATGKTGTTPQVKVTVPVPPGTKQGDVMLALLQADYGNLGGTLPSGWKLINKHLEGRKGRDLSLHAYYKIAAATGPRSYTWNVVNAARHPLAGGTILTFRGVDQASPVFASTVNPETANRAKINCPSVNAPNGGLLVCGFTHDDPQPDIKVPATMTRVSNFIIRNDDAHAVAYEPIAKAGATGLRSATINPDLKGGKNDISMAISLRPSAVNSRSPGPKSTPPNKKTAPRVLSTFPKANAKAVAPKASLRATFSEKMRASSINTKTFKLFKKGSTKKLSARVTYNAATKKATLNPTTSLRKGLTYKAVLSSGAKDVAGKSLDQKRPAKGLQQKVWSFTVRK
jgi:Bacterial Ig-like domain